MSDSTESSGESGSGSGDVEDLDEEPLQNGTTKLSDVNKGLGTNQRTYKAAEESKEEGKPVNELGSKQQQQQQTEKLEQMSQQMKTRYQEKAGQNIEDKINAMEREEDENGSGESGNEESGESGSGDDDDETRAKLVEKMVTTFAKAANFKNDTKEDNEMEEEEEDEESGEEAKDTKDEEKNKSFNNEEQTNETYKDNDYTRTVTRSVDDLDENRFSSDNAENREVHQQEMEVC